jgi:hypothetical protein
VDPGSSPGSVHPGDQIITVPSEPEVPSARAVDDDVD